jgi:signal peptidase I
MGQSDENPLLNSPDGRRNDGGMNLPPGFGGPPPQGEPSAPIRQKPVDEMVEELSRVPAAPKPSAEYVKQKSAALKNKEEPKHDDSVGGVIDTFEAIIIALILALTFRAFVVEAFVIPTGSMAPTLLGAHYDVLCPKCGYHFAENANLGHQFTPDGSGGLKDNTGNDRGELVDSVGVWAGNLRYCPNCGYEISAKELPDHVKTKRLAGREYQFPWTNNGDRILVMKYLYSVVSPQRYDVIVFKEPVYTRDNYIKRLIGLPGETIEIIDGDIYVGQGDAGRSDRAQRFIQRKPRHIQESLWQIVYDNDFHPIDAGAPRVHFQPSAANDTPRPISSDKWVNPWTGSGWEFGKKDPTVAECAGSSPATLAFLPPEHLKNNPTLAFYTCNILGYNSIEVLKANNGGRTPVGDLHLETVWTPQVDGQSIVVTLGKSFNQWRATLSAAGDVTLDRLVGDQYVSKAAARVAAPKANTPVRIVMNNVDHAVEFYIDGALAVEAVEKWSAADAIANNQAERYQPRPKIEITTTGKLEHLKLMRDLYYTQSATNSDNYRMDDGVNDLGATGSYNRPLTLGPDEFFALGDNSTASSDGRMWSYVVPALDDLGTRRGIVPRRYLLGKAFFVYWPAGFRATKKTFDTPLLNSPLVPNTGDMRPIR